MEKYFIAFNNLFHGIIAGPLLIFVILYLQLDSGRMQAPLANDSFILHSVAAFVLNIGYLFWVFRRFNIERRNLVDKYDLKKRLEAYKSVSSRFYLLMTIPGLLAIFAVFITGEMSFAFIYMIQLFLLSVYRPSVHNICKYLNLKDEEREFVLKKKEFGE